MVMRVCQGLPADFGNGLSGFGHDSTRLESDRVDDAVKSLRGAANRLSLGMLASALIVGGGYVLGALIRRGEGVKGWRRRQKVKGKSDTMIREGVR
jgi:hypothetical protein